MEKKITEKGKRVHPQNTRKKDRVWPLNFKMKLWRFGVARLGPAWWGVSFSLRFLLRVVLMCFLVMVTSSVVLEDREDTLRQPRSHTVRGRQHHTGSDSFRPRLFGQRPDVDRRSRRKPFLSSALTACAGFASQVGVACDRNGCIHCAHGRGRWRHAIVARAASHEGGSALVRQEQKGGRVRWSRQDVVRVDMRAPFLDDSQRWLSSMVVPGR